MLLTSLWNQGDPLLQWGVVVAAAAIAAATDLRRRRIYNWLTLPLLASGLAWATFTAGFAGLTDGLAACVALALPYVILFVFAQGGAGDAKLMGAIGAWLGLINGAAALAAVAVAGIVLAIGTAIANRRGSEVMANVSGLTVNLAVAAVTRGQFGVAFRNGPAPQGMLTMPYGVAIFVGTACAGAGVLLWRT